MQIALTHPATSPQIDLAHTLDAWLEQCAMFAVRVAKEEGGPAEVEAELIGAARNGDEDAFREIVERYQKTLSEQMGRFSRDRNVVEDLVHDVFVEAFMSLGSFKGRSPLEHWLRKIAVRVGYRHWKLEARDKRRLKRIRDEALPAINVADPPVDAVDAQDQLHVMLPRLSPRDRLVLTLLYWDGHSVAKAAELAGWTQSMVKVQAHRARTRLKKLLEESDEN